MTEPTWESIDHAESEIAVLRNECDRLRAEVKDKVEFNLRQLRENNLLQSRCDIAERELSELRGHVNVFVSSLRELQDQK